MTPQVAASIIMAVCFALLVLVFWLMRGKR